LAGAKHVRVWERSALVWIFLPDVWNVCETCHGKRYNEEVIKCRYLDKTIADILDLTVSEALIFFKQS